MIGTLHGSRRGGMTLRIRKWFSFMGRHVDHGYEQAALPRKVAAASVVDNPYAARQAEDLRPAASL
jgi:hypothetical protein